MERACICGYQVYKDIWDGFISEDIKCQKEFSNPKDHCTVAVLCITCPFAEVMTTEEMLFDKHLCGSGRTSALELAAISKEETLVGSLRKMGEVYNSCTVHVYKTFCVYRFCKFDFAILP